MTKSLLQIQLLLMRQMKIKLRKENIQSQRWKNVDMRTQEDVSLVKDAMTTTRNRPVIHIPRKWDLAREDGVKTGTHWNPALNGKTKEAAGTMKIASKDTPPKSKGPLF